MNESKNGKYLLRSTFLINLSDNLSLYFLLNAFHFDSLILVLLVVFRILSPKD